MAYIPQHYANACACKCTSACTHCCMHYGGAFGYKHICPYMRTCRYTYTNIYTYIHIHIYATLSRGTNVHREQAYTHTHTLHMHTSICCHACAPSSFRAHAQRQTDRQPSISKQLTVLRYTLNKYFST